MLISLTTRHLLRPAPLALLRRKHPLAYSTPKANYVTINHMNLTTGASADQILSLDNIRSQLIRLEDTIIFCECAERSSEARPWEREISFFLTAPTS